MSNPVYGYDIECYEAEDGTLFMYETNGENGSPAIRISADAFRYFALELLLMAHDHHGKMDVFNLRGCVTKLDNENL